MGILQGLSSYNGKLYAAWKGEVGDDRLFYSSFDGNTWTSQVTLAGNSSVGPALAASLGGSMFAAWKGEHSDERLFFMKYTGNAWQQQQQIACSNNVFPASSVGPSLAVFNNKLYAAWKGSDSDQSLWYASFNGSVWSSQIQIICGTLIPASSIGPSLAVFNNKLYAAWKGIANDQGIYCSSFDGGKWSSQIQIPNVASSVGPSLAVFNNKLYAAWKGDSSDQSLWYASFDGSKWSSQTQIPGVASSIGPALSEFNGKLYAMWKGSGSDQSLWYSFFDGTKWSSQKNVPGNTGQDLPQNIGLRMQYQEADPWCWIAVGTSVALFYNPASPATQCGIMTTVGNTINKYTSSACPSASAIAKVPGLSAILANPYDKAALYVLENDNATLGIPSEYFKTGGVGDALNVYGNWNSPSLSSITLEQITTEINAGRPIAVDVVWDGGNGESHYVAIVGVLNDLLLICDPIFGETVIQYELFPNAYKGGATLGSVCLTKKGS